MSFVITKAIIDEYNSYKMIKLLLTDNRVDFSNILIIRSAIKKSESILKLFLLCTNITYDDEIFYSKYFNNRALFFLFN